VFFDDKHQLTEVVCASPPTSALHLDRDDAAFGGGGEEEGGELLLKPNTIPYHTTTNNQCLNYQGGGGGISTPTTYCHPWHYTKFSSVIPFLKRGLALNKYYCISSLTKLAVLTLLKLFAVLALPTILILWQILHFSMLLKY